jgi:hypothetical protein
MNTSFRRAYGWLVIGISASAAVNPSAAQQVSLRPQAIGQIVNEVLDALAPSTGPRPHPIWKRGVVFDYQRTLAAFHQSRSVRPSDLALRHSMKAGSAAMLEDCDQFGTKPCSKLGWDTYCYIEPVSISESEARVRVHFLAAHRNTPFVEGVIPTDKAYLQGGATLVYLSRAKGGSWKFLKTGPSDVM